MARAISIRTLACLLGGILTLAACGDGPAEEGGEELDEASEEVQEQSEEAAEEVQEGAEEAAGGENE